MTRGEIIMYSGVVLLGLCATGAAEVFRPLDLRQVKVGGAIGGHIDATIAGNLLLVDIENDFLRPFQSKTASDGFVGVGMTLDAIVHFAAYTGDADVIALKDRVVAALINAQEPDGYIGMMKPDQRIRSLWDIHEMSYIIQGLLANHWLFGHQASLDAARRTADCIILRWTAEPDTIGRWDITTYMGVTGLEPALLMLHDATGDEKYRDFCVHFRGLADWEGRIVRGRWGDIEGHAYAYLSRCLAQLHLQRMTGDAKLFRNTQPALDFLLKGDGLTIIGACGQHECWHDTQDGAANLGETCATAYLLFWWDQLLRLQGDTHYGDVMDRTVHNALFAAHSPDARRIRYYTPFEGKREYFKDDTYCCPCNFRRIMSKLPGMVYYVADDGVVVNLYTTSEAMATLRDGTTVRVAQETDYPRGENILIRVAPEKPATFTLRLRIPKWCAGAHIAINGEAVPGPITAGTFHAIRREWQADDEVAVQFPMQLRLVKGRRAQAGRAAVLYGPQVFTLSRAHNPALAGEDLRLLTIKPETLAGPFPAAPESGGYMTCTVEAWKTTSWYPHGKPEYTLTLTEFADPDGEMVYFHLPNPEDPALVDDELVIQ